MLAGKSFGCGCFPIDGGKTKKNYQGKKANGGPIPDRPLIVNSVQGSDCMLFAALIKSCSKGAFRVQRK